MIPRQLASTLRRYAEHYPVVGVTGPRQSGKTTLVKALFADRAYYNLERPDHRAFAREDPRGFLADMGWRGVIDEVQYAPELFSYIQAAVDESGLMGQFILTGSQNFSMMEKVTQSLAGRIAIASLLPLSMTEIRAAGALETGLDETLFRGFYPRLHDQHLDPEEALRFYVQTYLERDVRQLIQIGDLDRFGSFLKLCAGRSGQLMNTSALGSEVGVSHNTIRQWLSVLEASYLIFKLRPWHANLGKRLVRTPKYYFVDVGLNCHLLGIRNLSHLKEHPMRGPLFENLIVAEAMKQRVHGGHSPDLLFFRDPSGREVDLLLEDGPELHAVEIKSAQTIHSDFFRNLDYFAKLSGHVSTSTLVYGGTEKQIRSSVAVQPWSSFSIPACK